MKKSSNEYGTEPFFIGTVSLKSELLKTLENELDFFPLAKFFFTHSSTMKPYECSIMDSKEEISQDKNHVTSIANFAWRNVETMTFKALSITLEGILDKTRHFYEAATLIL